MNDSAAAAPASDRTARQHRTGAGPPARARTRAQAWWRVHGAETAAVAAGTALAGAQALRLGLGPGPGSGSGPGDVPGLAPVLGPGTGLLPLAVALLCTAGVLHAVAGTVRSLLGRRAWPAALLAAGALAAHPPALSRLFLPGLAGGHGTPAGLAGPSGLSGPLYVLAAALLVRVLAAAAVRGRLPHPRTAACAGLCTVLAAWAAPQGLPLALVYPAALLPLLRRAPAGGLLRAVAVFGTAGVLPCAVLLARLRDGTGYPGAEAALPTAGYAWVVAAAVLAGLALGAAVPRATAAAAVLTGTAALLLGPAAAGRTGALLIAALGLAALGLAAAGPGGRTVLGRIGARAVGLAAVGMAALLWAGTAPAPVGQQPALVLAAVLGAALVHPGRTRRTLGALIALRTRGFRTPAGPGAVTGALAACAFLTVPAAPPVPTPLQVTEPDRAALLSGYAERLGLDRSTVALAPPLGTPPPAGGQRVLDLTGRTDPHLAAAWRTQDMAALRRHLLDRVRPEFVHLRGPWATATGLTAGRLAAHGYRPLLREGAGGDYVHRSAVTVPELLPALRELARSRATQPPARAPLHAPAPSAEPPLAQASPVRLAHG